MKYKVRVEERLVKEIEVEAKNFNEVNFLVKYNRVIY